jgi:hypothetical protein
VPLPFEEQAADAVPRLGERQDPRPVDTLAVEQVQPQLGLHGYPRLTLGQAKQECVELGIELAAADLAQAPVLQGRGALGMPSGQGPEAPGAEVSAAPELVPYAPDARQGDIAPVLGEGVVDRDQGVAGEATLGAGETCPSGKPA